MKMNIDLLYQQNFYMYRIFWTWVSDISLTRGYT